MEDRNKDETEVGEKRKVDWKEHKKNVKEWKKQKLKKKEDNLQKQKISEVSNRKPKTDKRREFTLSIAIPGSILDNAQSRELRTYLIGQIGRAAAVFNCDEIVVYDEQPDPSCDMEGNHNVSDDQPHKRCVSQMAMTLQYLECPQYLRKDLFPLHKDLQCAGILNPLDAVHHLKADDVSPYREGIVTNIPGKNGSHVNIGLSKNVQIDKFLTVGVRATIKIDVTQSDEVKKWKGVVVGPDAPCKEGLYWGYNVRIANRISEVIKNCPFPEPYDLVIGTSERGDPIADTLPRIPNDFKHILLIFGGLKGIEWAVESDVNLNVTKDPRDLFNFYINTCPNQGSNTIRTEEAILISLAALQPKLLKSKSTKK